jgi:hypothetical protein
LPPFQKKKKKEGEGLGDARERERGGAFAGKCARVVRRLRLTIGSCMWVAHLVGGRRHPRQGRGGGGS